MLGSSSAVAKNMYRSVPSRPGRTTMNAPPRTIATMRKLYRVRQFQIGAITIIARTSATMPVREMDSGTAAAISTAATRGHASRPPLMREPSEVDRERQRQCRYRAELDVVRCGPSDSELLPGTPFAEADRAALELQPRNGEVLGDVHGEDRLENSHHRHEGCAPHQYSQHSGAVAPS